MDHDVWTGFGDDGRDDSPAARPSTATIKGGDKVVVHQRLGDLAAPGPGFGEVIELTPQPPGEKRPLTPPTELPTVLSRGQKV